MIENSNEAELIPEENTINNPAEKCNEQASACSTSKLDEMIGGSPDLWTWLEGGGSFSRLVGIDFRAHHHIPNGNIFDSACYTNKENKWGLKGVDNSLGLRCCPWTPHSNL